MRGRDIKRYGYEWDKNDSSSLWLINTHNGIRGKYPPISINDYPAVKQHLDCYWDRIKNRDDKGVTPYNLRNCAYMDDFYKPKIVWAELARTGNAFAVDHLCHFVGNTGYILTVKGDDETILYYLLGILNSRIMLYCLNQITSRFDENGWRWLRQYVEQLKVPINTDILKISELARTTNRGNQLINSDKINKLVAEQYGLDDKEQQYINDKLFGY